MDLYDTTSCPVDRRCATCGYQDPDALSVEVVKLGLPGGSVGCFTLCAGCIEDEKLPRLGLPEAVESGMRHCQHLGITVDEMAEQLRAEQ